MTKTQNVGFLWVQDHGAKSGGYQVEVRLSSSDLYYNNLYDTYVFKVEERWYPNTEDESKPTASGTVQPGHEWRIRVRKVSTTC